MARRQLIPPKTGKYEFQNDVECETSPRYGGNHLVKPTIWPPRSINKGDDNPSVALRCERCGSWCIVYKDNKADDSMIDVEYPVPTPKKEKDKELVTK